MLHGIPQKADVIICGLRHPFPVSLFTAGTKYAQTATLSTSDPQTNSYGQLGYSNTSLIQPFKHIQNTDEPLSTACKKKRGQAFSYALTTKPANT